jgi:hypothetical protein
MFFESAENVLAFYIRYAQLAGFDIRRNITRNMIMHKRLSVKSVGNTMEARDRIGHVTKLQRKRNAKQ